VLEWKKVRMIERGKKRGVLLSIQFEFDTDFMTCAGSRPVWCVPGSLNVRMHGEVSLLCNWCFQKFFEYPANRQNSSNFIFLDFFHTMQVVRLLIDLQGNLTYDAINLNSVDYFHMNHIRSEQILMDVTQRQEDRLKKQKTLYFKSASVVLIVIGAGKT
jgi:hypothetical protein